MSVMSLGRLIEFQFYLLIFSLPFEYYFAGRQHALFSTVKLQVALLVATWIVGLLFKSGFLRTVRPGVLLEKIRSDRLVTAVLVFVVVELIASAVAPVYRGNALRAGFKTAGGAFLALMSGLVFSSREGRPRTHIILIMLALSGTCMALLGLGERAGIPAFSWIVNSFQPSRYFLGNHLRMVSTMEYPNTAGSFLSVTICATVALMVFPGYPRVRLWRAVYPAMVILQTLALTLTYSRGAMGATIAAIGAAAWTMRRFRGERHSAFALVACLVLLISGMGYLTLVRRTAEVEKPITSKRTAHYGLDAGDKREVLQAGSSYSQTIAVQNQSSNVWRRSEQGLAYRWYSFQTSRRSPLFIAGEFPADIPPEESRRIPVTLHTPTEAGQYMLIWFVFVREDGVRELRNSFSPGIICSVGNGQPLAASSSVAFRYAGDVEGERRLLNEALVPGRWELWSAAFRMAWHRPLLGIGPDNFRILKWTYMDLPKGDETILANNLYLELLSGSGVLGLVSFLWLAVELGRRISRNASLRDPSGWGVTFFGISYVAVFLLHGFVDYFLKFTPTFLLFWLLLGTVSRQANREDMLETRI